MVQYNRAILHNLFLFLHLPQDGKTVHYNNWYIGNLMVGNDTIRVTNWGRYLGWEGRSDIYHFFPWSDLWIIFIFVSMSIDFAFTKIFLYIITAIPVASGHCTTLYYYTLLHDIISTQQHNFHYVWQTHELLLWLVCKYKYL